jgi:hypothetical protein
VSCLGGRLVLSRRNVIEIDGKEISLMLDPIMLNDGSDSYFNTIEFNINFEPIAQLNLQSDNDYSFKAIIKIAYFYKIGNMIVLRLKFWFNDEPSYTNLLSLFLDMNGNFISLEYNDNNLQSSTDDVSLYEYGIESSEYTKYRLLRSIKY